MALTYFWLFLISITDIQQLTEEEEAEQFKENVQDPMLKVSAEKWLSVIRKMRDKKLQADNLLAKVNRSIHDWIVASKVPPPPPVPREHVRIKPLNLTTMCS